MSLQLFKSDILFFQRILTVSGFYDGPLNGRWSSDVDKAEDEFDADYVATKNAYGELDKRTEKNIATLIPKAQKKAREFMKVAKGYKHDCRIISGTRTYAEQDQLYAIGRTIQKNHRPVTKARGGASNHNFSIAWDVGLFDGGRYMDGKKKGDDEAYVELAALIKSQVAGLEWGGDWDSFYDPPHYQLATNLALEDVRAKFEDGLAYA